MKEYLDYFLVLLAQFAGGPGPRENNLVRYGLAAVLWAALLVVAWLRQRRQELPRERLLVWGFGLGCASELFMFLHVSMGMLGYEPGSHYAEPLEHGLTLAAVVMVAGAFLLYILGDARLARRYVQIGLGFAVVSFAGTWWWWHRYAAANPEHRFNQTWAGLYFYVVTAVFAGIAIFLLSRKRGWLRNVVSIALSFFVVIGVLRTFNFATDREYASVVCPICNILHILAIPLLGYVYIREQSIEKAQVEEALGAYRDHLEELVVERTAKLTEANEQLQREISERKEAEVEIAWRNSELAAQNAIAATLSRSLDIETILSTALDTVLAVLEMDAGCIYLLEPDGETLGLRMRRGKVMPESLVEPEGRPCSCAGISRQAICELQPVVQYVDDFPADCQSSFVVTEELRILIGTPLVAKDRAVGALSLGSQRPERIPSQELEMLAAIGQQIGMAVENARLYRDAERWAEELALLHESSIVLAGTLDPATIYHQVTEQAAKLLGCQVASIFRWDEETGEALEVFSYGLDESGLQRLQIWPQESSLLQELISDHRSVAIEDGQSDPRIPPLWRERYGVKSLLCLPLRGKERPLGFLFLVDRLAPRRWQVSEVTWAESFVNNAAIALENAYLYEQAERAATLEERQRIASDMHDGLAQTLSYLTLKAGYATDLLEEGRVPEVLEEYADIQSAVERAIREVRRSIASLRESPQPRQPLQDSLAEMLGGFAKEGVPPMKLVTDLQDPLFIPSHYSAQVLRVVQEALWNAVRHAGAQQITVRLEKHGGEVTAIVEDNGCGFDPSETRVDGGEHFGLSIMRARAAHIGGVLDIDSVPGQGTRVSLTWSDARIRAQRYQAGRDTESLIPALRAEQS